jgi:membrane associated rhomboid family serine protease
MFSLTEIIIILTCLISIIGFQNHEFFYKTQFNPYQVKYSKEWFRFFTHAFLHADWMHLIVNMFVLYFFGRNVEMYFQYYLPENESALFLMMYFGAILFAVLPTYKKYNEDWNYNSVGASGAVSAIVFSSIMFDPLKKICLYGILCFPGIAWGVFYLGYSWYMGKKGGDHINHDAHFVGAVFGLIFTIGCKPELLINFIEKLIH